MKYLLSYNVGTRNKFSNALDEDDDNDNNNKGTVEDSEEYEDYIINNGVEDL